MTEILRQMHFVHPTRLDSSNAHANLPKIIATLSCGTSLLFPTFSRMDKWPRSVERE